MIRVMPCSKPDNEGAAGCCSDLSGWPAVKAGPMADSK